MQSDAVTPEEYMAQLPAERKQSVQKLREVVLKNLPIGFTEIMAYGMLGYVVPHSIYPPGYHCDSKQALPFINIASQKNFVALYHMGLYGDAKLSEWFRQQYPLHSTAKLDMGKSCIRFKKPDAIPFDLIAELVAKISVADYIALYEAQLKK